MRERYGAAALPDLTATAAAVHTGRGAPRPGERAAQTEAKLLIAADARAEAADRVHRWLEEHAGDLHADLTRNEAVDSRLRADLFQPAPAIGATATRIHPTASITALAPALKQMLN